MRPLHLGALFSDQLADLTTALTLAILVTTLLFLLAQSIRLAVLEFWTLSWGSLSLGLSLLLVGAVWREGWDQFAAGAFCVALGIANAFLLVGCLSLRHERSAGKLAWLLVPPVAVAAALLPPLSDAVLLAPPADPSLVRRPERLTAGLLQTVAALASIHVVRGVQRYTSRRRTGLRVLLAALTAHGVMGLLFLLFQVWPSQMPEILLPGAFWARLDGVTQVLMAFGMIIVALESVRRELEKANRELSDSSARWARLAHSDAMTEALNRHAFYSLIESRRTDPSQTIGGAVVLLDLNDLKPLNDRFGHAAGDAAIRSVAKAVRSIIRPDDLLFRWGGDEFLVILPNVSASEAQQRMALLHDRLRGTNLPGILQPVDLDVSFGVAAFSSVEELEQAVTQADSAMYSHKARRKNRSLGPSPSQKPEPSSFSRQQKPKSGMT